MIRGIVAKQRQGFDESPLFKSSSLRLTESARLRFSCQRGHTEIRSDGDRLGLPGHVDVAIAIGCRRRGDAVVEACRRKTNGEGFVVGAIGGHHLRPRVVTQYVLRPAHTVLFEKDRRLRTPIADVTLISGSKDGIGFVVGKPGASLNGSRGESPRHAE